MKAIIAAFIAAILLIGLGVGTATATPTSINAVVMGDSYGSGTGAGNYEPGTEHACWRSRNSYSELVVEALRASGKTVNFTNATCSGAKIDDLSRVYQGQPPQLDSLRSNTTLVLLTVSGNDAGFGPYLGACLNGACEGEATQEVLRGLPAVGKKLYKLLGEIKVRSPRARIVLVGYGRPLTDKVNAANVPLDPICADQFFTLEERKAASAVSSGLDATMRFTAAAAKYNGGVDVKYVSPYATPWLLSSSFQGHSLCEASPRFYRGFDALAPGQEGSDALAHLGQAGHSVLSVSVLAAARV